MIPENNNDFILYNHGPMNSSIFFNNNGKPLYYLPKFQIHVDSISCNITKVSVKTLNSEIIAGSTFGLVDNFGIRQANFIEVEPSTIEEYEILRIIGKALGVPMPNPCLINVSDKQFFKIKKGRILFK